MSHIFSFVLIVLFSLTVQAAKVGGVFQLHMSSDPTTLNPITSTDVYASEIQAWVMDSLMEHDPNTYELKPRLAEKYELSKDGMEVIFTVREGAKFHDGKPVTLEDIKFSFDVIFDPNFDTAHLRPYYENLEKPEILDAKRIKFKFKKKYFMNLETVATTNIVPKHVYQDPKAKVNKTIVGSGPYKFESYDRSSKLVLVRNPDWWGFKYPEFKDRYNFDKVLFRIIQNEDVALETFKKGDLDFLDLTAEQFNAKAVGPDWGTKYLKIKTENKTPKGYGYVGWNFNNEMFKQREVRVALSHLINRKLMNEKFRFNMSLLVSSPVYPAGELQPKGVEAIPFNPKKALELFKKAGWEDTDKNGVLDKTINGQKREMKFTLMTANPDSMKYLTIFKEDAKKSGVDIDLKVLEWNSFMKLIDEGKFDAVSLGWGGGSPESDLKQIWHSASTVKGGSNFIGFKNPEVDKYIDQAREEMDKKKRVPMWQKAAKIIAEEQPYSFLFTHKYVLYAASKRLKRPKDTYQYSIGASYWWVD